jgi:hypothetical protein
MRHRPLWSAAAVAVVILASLWCGPRSHSQGLPTLAHNIWQPVNGPPGGSVDHISLSPTFASDQTVYAAAGRSGVYRSTDGGATWSAVGAAYFCGS